MGVLYLAFPLEPEMNAYLEQQGVAVPSAPSRNPTPKEIRAAVQGIPDIRAEMNESPAGELIQVMLTTFESEDGPWTLLNVRENEGRTSLVGFHLKRDGLFSLLRSLYDWRASVGRWC